MCGRYLLTEPADVLAALFGLSIEGELRPRYNIAPTQCAPVAVERRAGARELVEMRWGLVPFWAKDRSIGARMINARSETAAEKPAFRAAMKKRRCAVPASGFYEWKKLGPRTKQPWLLRRADGRPLVFAGLWESFTDVVANEELLTYTILTTSANELVASVHDRMPVILSPESIDRWLDPDRQDPAALQELLRPAPDEVLEAYPIGIRVNSPRNDDPALVERVDELRG